MNFLCRHAQKEVLRSETGTWVNRNLATTTATATKNYKWQRNQTDYQQNFSLG